MVKKIILLSFIILFHTIIFHGCGDGTRIERDPNDASSVTIDNNNDENFTVAQLDSLTISPGKLTPEFNPGIYNYSIILMSDISTLKATVISSAGNTVEISNAEPSTENNAYLISITEPEKNISISVYSEAGEGVIYYLKIRRMVEKNIPNSSFELFDELKHPEQWEVTGSGELLCTDAGAYSGQYSGTFTTLTTSISGREAISTAVEIEQGRGITLSGWFFIDNISGLSPERVLFSFKVFYFTDTECSIPASTTASTMTKIPLTCQGVWEKITYERKPEQVPHDAAFARIGVRACYDKESGGTKSDRAFFDFIQLQQ